MKKIRAGMIIIRFHSRLLTSDLLEGALQPLVGHGLLIHEVSRSHTPTHHSWYDSSGQMIK
jgi:hypothetical protein